MEDTPPKELPPRPRRRRAGWSIKLTPVGLLLLLGLNVGILALVAQPLLELRQYLPIAQPVTISPAQSSRTPTLTATLEPNTAWTAQTPQAYKLDVLEKALAAAAKKKAPLQDESAALELIKHEVHLVPCPPSNIRIANPEDLTLAEALKRL